MPWTYKKITHTSFLCLYAKTETMKKENSTLKTVIGGLLGLYAFSTQIMAVYFWWQLMKKDSFIMGIFIDPFIAEFKGILWPFFI